GVGHQQERIAPLGIVGIGFEDKVQVFAPLIIFFLGDQGLPLLEELLLGGRQNLLSELVRFLGFGGRGAGGDREAEQRNRGRGGERPQELPQRHTRTPDPAERIFSIAARGSAWP